VSIHPRSINEKQYEFESPFLLYHLKLKSTSIYLHDTTMVYPLPLLFFGRGVDICMEDGLETIAVDKSIHFKCQESTANLVKVSGIYKLDHDKKAPCQKMILCVICCRNWEQGWTSC
jgi:ATP-dependent RNA helicase DHX36